MIVKSAIACFVTLNVAAFLLMGWDKRCAILHKWRVPEKWLFLLSWCFGGIGIGLAMYVFWHKIRHWSFRILVPLGIIFNCMIVWLVFFKILV